MILQVFNPSAQMERERERSERSFGNMLLFLANDNLHELRMENRKFHRELAKAHHECDKYELRLSYYDSEKRSKRRKVVCEQRSYWADGGASRGYVTNWETDSEEEQNGGPSKKRRQLDPKESRTSPYNELGNTDFDRTEWQSFE